MRRISQISEPKPVTSRNTAVGAPEIDRSASILSQGALNFATALMDRQEKVDTVAAMSKFGDFNLAYGMAKSKLQQDFRDTPAGYPKAAKDAADQLVSETTKSMSPGVGEKFRNIVTSSIAQDQDNNVNWSLRRDQEIAIGNVQKGYTDLALAAELVTSPEEVTQLLGNLEYQHQISGAVVDEASNKTLKDATRKDIIENSLNGAMLADATKTYTDIVRGKYGHILTPLEAKKYEVAAKDRMIAGALHEQFHSLATSAVELSTLGDQVLDKTVTVADINRRLNWAELNKDKKDVNGEPIISVNYLDGLKNLKNMALGLDTRTRTEKSVEGTAFSADFDRRWDDFLLNRKKGKASPKDYDDVLSMYSELLQKYNSGAIDEGVFNTKKKLLDTGLSVKLNNKAVSASLTQALQDAGKKKIGWFLDKQHSVYDEGFRIIRNYTDSRIDLSVQEKANLNDQLLLGFVDQVKKLPADQLNGVKQYQKFATDTLNGSGNNPGLLSQLALYKHPETGDPLMYGQRTIAGGHPAVFAGIDSKTGDYLFLPVKDLKPGLNNR